MSAVMATLLPLTYNMRAAAAVGAAQRAVDAERRARAVEVALAKSASMSMLGRAPTASASWLESAASAAAAAGGWCGGGVGGEGSLRGGIGSLGLSASVPALGLGSVPAPGLEGLALLDADEEEGEELGPPPGEAATAAATAAAAARRLRPSSAPAHRQVAAPAAFAAFAAPAHRQPPPGPKVVPPTPPTSDLLPARRPPPPPPPELGPPPQGGGAQAAADWARSAFPASASTPALASASACAPTSASAGYTTRPTRAPPQLPPRHRAPPLLPLAPPKSALHDEATRTYVRHMRHAWRSRDAQAAPEAPAPPYSRV